MKELHDLLESYYEEIDPDQRLALLREYQSGPGCDDPAADYRKALYDYRYLDPKMPDRKVDKYLMAVLDLLYLFRGSIVLPGRYVKEVKKIMRDLERDERVLSDEAFEEAYVMEVRNAVRRYFDTCKSDSYHKKFFGITHSTADEKEKQRCLDAYRMSAGIAERLHLEKEMELFCRAVAEEYRLSRADGMTLTDAYQSYRK